MTRREPIDDALQQRTAVPSPATKPYFANRPWLLALVLAVVTFVAYQPAWHAGFIWDDDRLITDNRMVQARDGLYRIWFTTEAADYYPLTSSFWWLQWRLWGKNAGGYHAVNVLLHAANVVLIWMLLRRLRVPGAWLAALVFAIHPVNVATVAWISEQKNTLSMLFFALSILWYVRFDEESKGHWYGLSLAAFLLALLSKSAVVMLPVVLLGCVWWLRGRVRRQDLLRSVPFFVLSLVMGLVTIWFQYNRVLGDTRLERMAFFLTWQLPVWRLGFISTKRSCRWIFAWSIPSGILGPGVGVAGCPGLRWREVLRFCGGSATAGAGRCCLGSGILS